MSRARVPVRRPCGCVAGRTADGRTCAACDGTGARPYTAAEARTLEERGQAVLPGCAPALRQRSLFERWQDGE